MIQKLGDALSLPLAVRNQLLAHAGFAARYAQRGWNSEEMAPIREAVGYTLRQHTPYPAIAIDRYWTILQMNRSAERLFAFIGADVARTGCNAHRPSYSDGLSCWGFASVPVHDHRAVWHT